MKKRVYKIVIFLMIIVLLSSATGYYYFIECVYILKFTQVSNETNITLFAMILLIIRKRLVISMDTERGLRE